MGRVWRCGHMVSCHLFWQGVTGPYGSTVSLSGMAGALLGISWCSWSLDPSQGLRGALSGRRVLLLLDLDFISGCHEEVPVFGADHP